MQAHGEWVSGGQVRGGGAILVIVTSRIIYVFKFSE
jgi:hypothetical protein